jgi:hypothetical protein
MTSSLHDLKESAMRLLPPDSAARAAILSCPEEVPDGAVVIIAKQFSALLSREMAS